jgi:hypothetical protein
VHGGMQAREATLGDLLQAGAHEVDQSFAAQPEIRDEVFAMLIELYVDTGDQKQVIELAQHRLAAAQKAFGDDDARTVPAYVMLAGVDIAFGEMAEVPKLLSHAQAILDRIGDRTSFDRARLLRWQGIYDYVMGVKPPWEENKELLAANLLRERYPTQEDELTGALSMLASIACKYGKSQEAVDIASEFLRRTVERHGSDNLYVDEANALMAQFGMYAGHAKEAVPVLESSVQGMVRHVGPKSPDVIATQFLLVEALLAAGDAPRSEEILRTAREAIARDHADDKSLPEQLAVTQGHLDEIRRGTPHSCASK